MVVTKMGWTGAALSIDTAIMNDGPVSVPGPDGFQNGPKKYDPPSNVNPKTDGSRMQIS